MRMSFRWVLVAWTSFCILGWLLAAGAWIGIEASCDESTSLFCFEPPDIWLATGILVAPLWVAGLLVATVVATYRRRKASTVKALDAWPTRRIP
jgi:hypothetical protein